MRELVRKATSALLFALLGVATACDAPTNGGAGGGGGTGGIGGDSVGRVVFVGAHPDDELYAAPWLAKLCLEDAQSCKFVVLTRGEAGNCKRTAGCTPDLASVRAEELTTSASHFNAELVHWNWGDGVASSPTAVLEAWSDRAGGDEALVGMVADELVGAARVVSFDPRHGDSCHADHRAAGAVAIAAVERAKLPASSVTLIASRLVLDKAVPEDTAVWGFDASQPLSSTSAPAWESLIAVLRAHTSQFTSTEVDMLRSTPPANQRTWLLNLENAVADDPRYEGLCE